MSTLTPIPDVDQKIDIIDHVNQDHMEELLAIVTYYRRNSDEPDTVVSAKIMEIYQEAMQVSFCLSDGITTDLLTIPFEIDGELEDKILYLAYAAVVGMGRDFSGSGKRFFEVIGKQTITANMVRLKIKSRTPLPEDYPGYAFGFFLKTIKKLPDQDAGEDPKKNRVKNMFDRLVIWLIKHMSSKNRQKFIQSANKDIRIYTLRRSWQSQNTAGFHDQGLVDIFTHGETAGSRWAQNLMVGDIIMSRSEMRDKHPHLASGQALLIADETAYPALAGILERWQNPLPPHVILLSEADEEQSYFIDEPLANTDTTGCKLPGTGHLRRVVCPPENQASEVLAILDQLETVDVVWAAFESAAAKKVRHYLRNKRQVSGKNNHTKAYWVLK